MNETIYRKYARLMLEVGVNLQVGQKLHLQLEAEHWDFTRVVVDEAYKMGAGYVLVSASDPCELESRVIHAEEQSLSYVPSWIELRNQAMVDEGWARLSFSGSRDPDMVSRLDAQKVQLVQTSLRKAAKTVSAACGAGLISWAGAALPTRLWASKVFPQASADEAFRLLWQQMVDILHLDEEDPVTIWRSIGARTIARGRKLESLDLKEIHFEGPGTDLRVQCLEKSRWAGGGSELPNGVMTLPNIPSFESFTTPDYRGTQGRAQVNCPVNIMGRLVKGAWFVFENGKVVEYGADEHKEALDSMFAACPQTAYLGEVALVDGSSPIYSSGVTFFSTLFDENATSHIALGSGYAQAATGAAGKNSAELLEMGVNVSLLHHDVMIGGEQVEVTGISRNGERIPLIRGGYFTEELA